MPSLEQGEVLSKSKKKVNLKQELINTQEMHMHVTKNQNRQMLL